MNIVLAIAIMLVSIIGFLIMLFAIGMVDIGAILAIIIGTIIFGFPTTCLIFGTWTIIYMVFKGSK